MSKSNVNRFYQQNQTAINEVVETALRDYQQWFDDDTDENDIEVYNTIETELVTKQPLNNTYAHEAVQNYRQYLDDVLAEPRMQTHPNEYADYRAEAELLDTLLESGLV